MQQNASEFLDLRSVAQEYPIFCRRSWYAFARNGKVKSFLVSRKLVFRRQDVERFLTAKSATADLDKLVDEVVSEVLK